MQNQELHPDDEMAEQVAAEEPMSDWGKRKHINATTYTSGDARAAIAGAKGGAKTGATNGRSGGRPALDPADRPCGCGLGDATQPENHKSFCARKQAWRRQNNSMFA